MNDRDQGADEDGALGGSNGAECASVRYDLEKVRGMARCAIERLDAGDVEGTRALLTIIATSGDA